MSSQLHQPSGRSAYGVALAATTVAMWSILPLGLKIALGGLDPMTLTWIRFVAATLLLGSALRARGSMPAFDRLETRDRMLLAIAALGLAGNYGFYVLGLQYTNAGTAQVVIQLAPMLFTVGGIFIFHERFSLVQWLGFATLLAGLGVFSSDQIAHLLSGLDRYYTGLAFIFAAAVTWAAYGLAQKQLLRKMGSPQILMCLYTAGALLFLPLSHPLHVLSLSGVQAIAVVFCIANMLISYATFSESLEHLEASRVSAIIASVPLGTLTAIQLAALVNPAIFTAEPVTHTGVAGAAMVVAGSLMTSLKRRTD